MRQALLLEPYVELAEVLTDFLTELGYDVEVARDARLPDRFAAQHYECVLINLDQNHAPWRDYGLRLAEQAAGARIPVVMIADHHSDEAAIRNGGWQLMKKPFTLAQLRSAIGHAEHTAGVQNGSTASPVSD